MAIDLFPLASFRASSRLCSGDCTSTTLHVPFFCVDHCWGTFVYTTGSTTYWGFRVGRRAGFYDRTVGIWDLVVSLVELFLLPPLKFCADGFWKCFASGFLFCYSFSGEYKKNSRRTISKHRTKSSKILENRWLPVWIQLIFLQYLTFNISVNNLGQGQIRRFSPGITIHLCFVGDFLSPQEERNLLAKQVFSDTFSMCIFSAIILTEWYQAADHNDLLEYRVAGHGKKNDGLSLDEIQECKIWNISDFP